MKKININKEELLTQINNWIPLKLFAVFLWSLKHTLSVKNRERHPDFYKNDSMQGNISYVKTMFKRCLRFKIIDDKYRNFKIEKIFKD